MFEQLEEQNRRLEELDRLLQNPEVLGNPPLHRSYAQERGRLAKVVPPFREWKRIQEKIRQSEAILSAPDSEKELQELAREEIDGLRIDSAQFQHKLEELLLTSDEDASRNVIMEIRAGTGGEEAALFAGDLFRMYQRFAERKGWRAEVLHSSPSSLKGFKEIVFSIEGEEVYRHLRFESGGHRIQRVPVTEAGGRIHTSAATVAVLPEAEEVEIDIKPEELKVDTFRAGGKGGQHVNVTDSAVRITHLPTGLVVSIQDERSQHKNRAKALRVLRTRLYEHQRTQKKQERDRTRKEQIGSGDRNDRIRTYNIPQDRVTDHRIGLTLHNIGRILDGEMNELIEALLAHDRKERLSEMGRCTS
jgi:peptide chain release factor 1